MNEFTTSQEISYQFNELGIAQVEHKISILNNFSQFYPKIYNLSLSGSKATDIQAFDSNGNIFADISQNSDEIKIGLTLTNSKTGKDQITPLTIKYHSDSLAKQKGKTWEVSLPQFQDNLSNNTNITLTIPVSYGKLSSSPPGSTISTNSQNTIITFNKYNQKNKLVLTFGEYQLFNFDLKYHIKNTTNQENIYTIPIPPDTSNQKVLFNEINPNPLKIETDPDGNWLAFYQIPSQSIIDVKVSGQAKIGQNPNYNFISNPNFSTQLFWPVDNSEILDLASRYKTPKQIYDYVVTTLNYDFNRVNNSARRGALAALQNPETSLCTDFTDVFISIARANSIGAREIQGYAYSNNTDIKPLSIGTDVLHAWPEYYDNNTQKWIPIDPTWGKTTGGINYFNDLDLNHFSLVIHNTKSDSPPPPGSYKENSNQKSVDITFADSEIAIDTIKPSITSKFNPFSQSFIIIKNPNLFALDNFSVLNNLPQNILPLSETQINFPKVSFINSLFPKNQNLQITYNYNNQPSETITIQNPYHFFNLFLTIIFSLIFLSIGAIILLRHK